MPKATKDHRSKKNPQAHESYLRHKKENVSDEKILEQYNWRREQVKAKIEQHVGELITPQHDKLIAEAKSLSITVKVVTE